MLSTSLMMRYIPGFRLELIFCLVLCLLAVHAADSKAEFVGGTIEEFRAGQEGMLQLGQPDQLRFGTRAKRVAIPYGRVRSIEYGQKVDRRYLSALLVSPMFLLSKKRDHFLTVHYRDEKGEDQVLVLRLPKNTVRPTLASLEARTGLKVKVQDDEARKAYRS